MSLSVCGWQRLMDCQSIRGQGDTLPCLAGRAGTEWCHDPTRSMRRVNKAPAAALDELTRFIDSWSFNGKR